MFRYSFLKSYENSSSIKKIMSLVTNNEVKKKVPTIGYYIYKRWLVQVLWKEIQTLQVEESYNDFDHLESLSRHEIRKVKI